MMTSSGCDVTDSSAVIGHTSPSSLPIREKITRLKIFRAKVKYLKSRKKILKYLKINFKLQHLSAMIKVTVYEYRCRCKRLSKPWNLSHFLDRGPDYCVFFTSRQWRHSTVIPARWMVAGSGVRTLVSLHSWRHFAPQLRHQRRSDVIDHRFLVRATCCANEALLLRLVFVDPKFHKFLCCLVSTVRLLQL